MNKTVSATNELFQKINSATDYNIKSISFAEVSLTKSDYTGELYIAGARDKIVYSGKCACVVFSDDPITYYFIPKNIDTLKDRVSYLYSLDAPDAVIKAAKNQVKFYEILSEFSIYQ